MATERRAKDGSSIIFWNQLNVGKNNAAVNWVRTLMAIVTGAAAGVLGLKSMQGFAFFVACYAATSLALLMKMRFDADSFFPGTKVHTFLLSGIMSHLMSFLLFWTAFYGLCHVY